MKKYLLILLFLSWTISAQAGIWKNPKEYSEGGGWEHQWMAYDDNDATNAYVSIPPGEWCEILHLWVSATFNPEEYILCDKVRLKVNSYAGYIDRMQLWVMTLDDWFIIYDGSCPSEETPVWIEYPIPNAPQRVTILDIRAHCQVDGDEEWFDVYEVDFNKLVGQVITIN